MAELAEGGKILRDELFEIGLDRHLAVGILAHGGEDGRHHQHCLPPMKEESRLLHDQGADGGFFVLSILTIPAVSLGSTPLHLVENGNPHKEGRDVAHDDADQAEETEVLDHGNG